MKMRISTAKVRELAIQQGFDSVPTLTEAIRDADPEGKGISANSVKRYWHDDKSLQSFAEHVLVLLCLTFNCQPGDILVLENGQSPV